MTTWSRQAGFTLVVTITNVVHLMSDHVQQGRGVNWVCLEMSVLSYSNMRVLCTPVAAVSRTGWLPSGQRQ